MLRHLGRTGPSQGAAGIRQNVVEWRPGRRGASLLSLLALLLLLLGLAVYFRLATLLAPAQGRAGGAVLLLFLALTAALTLLLLAAHEGLHAMAARGFGARPRFGALLVGGILPALYTTAPGYLFSRGEYLAVVATPTVVISVLGAIACLTPAGLILVVPLAIHLSGCAGDLAAISRLVREPRGTRCEDLRDGIAFYRPAEGESRPGGERGTGGVSD